MSTDFGHGYYRSARYHGLSRKRQIIDLTLDDLHTMQLDMIDEAVQLSDLQEAKDVIDWIKNRD